MKCFVFVLWCVALVLGDPQRYPQFRFQRQQFAPEVESVTKTAPYPPSGWTPAGEPFNLPSPQQQSYGVPANEYGAAESTTPAEEETTTPSSDADTIEGLDTQQEENKSERLEAEIERVQGAYYVLLPDGQLQRVEFKTENDPRNMAFTTRLQYRSEDAAPVYVLQPEAEAAALQQYPFLPNA